MALDTPEKLLSILDGDPTTTPGMPLLDGAIGTPEQLHLLWLYSGLLGDEVEEEEGGDEAEEDAEPTPVELPHQRWLLRSAHFDQVGECSVLDFRVTIKRGIGSNADEPTVKLRVNRDNRGFGKWIARGLGRAGNRYNTINFGPLGTAHVFQFEIACDDDCDIEFQGMEAIIQRIGQ